MGDAADVDRIAQQVIQGPPAVAQPASSLAAARRPDLADNPALPEVSLKGRDRSKLCMLLEQIPDRFRFGFVDDELAVLDVVAQWQVAAHPHALALGRCDLVPDALARDLPLELGERQQHVQSEPPHRRRGVELLGYRHERGTLAVQCLDDPGKVRQRSSQPVDLVDHNHVDQSPADVGQQALQGGPLKRAAGEAAIVVGGPHQLPAFVSLTPYICLTRFPLGIEGVKGLVEPLLRRFTGVDGAAPRLAGHGLVSAASFRPKNRGPDQRVPVIWRAISDNEPKRSPRYSKPPSRTSTWCSTPRQVRVRTVPSFSPRPGAGV